MLLLSSTIEVGAKGEEEDAPYSARSNGRSMLLLTNQAGPEMQLAQIHLAGSLILFSAPRADVCLRAQEPKVTVRSAVGFEGKVWE